MTKFGEAPEVIEPNPFEHYQPSSDFYDEPPRNFLDGAQAFFPNVDSWDSTSPAPVRSWPAEHPALYNPAFYVLPSFAADHTTLHVPPESILYPIFQKERIHMDEAYMILEYVNQTNPSSGREHIQYQLAHMLRHKYLFVRDPDPQKGLIRNDSFELDKALWAKEEDLLHRRRYLELFFHSFSQGAIVFPHDPAPHRTYSLQKVLDMRDRDHVRLKLLEICDDLEPHWAFRTLRRDHLIGCKNSYVLLNGTYRHPDRFEGKIKSQTV